ncbi:MAG TPA: histidinol-phosphate transaminase [Candidatus Sumerlaeota bacterium]|nr:histidinol-phosphate transaminase [Candidatus Sumerlaeota bacterium]HOR27853.1 histidinol-phosphate transaminase [Candidatus Sumerlaeota bacterium]HPK02461.1 histidinol-phosphate transaminase [Candidatus Sumerlaeota bacterium]
MSPTPPLPEPNAFLAEIKPYEPGEQPQAPGFIKLNTNEFPYPAAPEVIEAIKREAADTVRVYPDPTCRALREALAAKHGLHPEQIIVGNGSDEILRLLFHAYVGAGRNLGIVQPTYTLFEVLARQFGARTLVFPLDASEKLSAGFLAAPWDAVFLPVPNPPIGGVFPERDLRKLAERGKLLVLDGAYIDFAQDHDPANLLAEFPNVVLTRSFSKSHGLAGMRLGYAMAHREIIANLNKLRDSYNVDRVTQAAGLAALAADRYYAKRCAEIVESRRKLAADLTKRGFKVPASQANFVFARHARAPEIYDALKQRKILVRHFNHSGLQGGVRITIGTPEENKALLYALDAIMPEGNFRR